MTRIRSTLASLVMLLPLLFLTLLPAAAQSPAGTVLDAETSWNIDFPSGIDLSATIRLPTTAEVVDIDLNYRAAMQQTWHLAFVPSAGITQAGTSINASVSLDLQSDFIPTGIELISFWRVHLKDGTSLDTGETRIPWIDPRFEWTTVSTGQVNVHSYALSPSFSQFIAETAQQTIDELEQRYELDQSQPIAIWMYANSSDFLATTPSNSREAVSGVSYPEYLLIGAIIAEGNTNEVGRTITHEISHQVLNQATRNPYGPPPLWFDEGMATHTQTHGTTGYLPLAVHAATQHQLFHLGSLDSGFPFEPGKAAIAYATSWSAVEYILQTWGDPGIARLIDAFAVGLPVNDALQPSLGLDLDELNEGFTNWLLAQALSTPVATPTGVQS